MISTLFNGHRILRGRKVMGQVFCREKYSKIKGVISCCFCVQGNSSFLGTNNHVSSELVKYNIHIDTMDLWYYDALQIVALYVL